LAVEVTIVGALKVFPLFPVLAKTGVASKGVDERNPVTRSIAAAYQHVDGEFVFVNVVEAPSPDAIFQKNDPLELEP